MGETPPLVRNGVVPRWDRMSDCLTVQAPSQFPPSIKAQASFGGGNRGDRGGLTFPIALHDPHALAHASIGHLHLVSLGFVRCARRHSLEFPWRASSLLCFSFASSVFPRVLAFPNPGNPQIPQRKKKNNAAHNRQVEEAQVEKKFTIVISQRCSHSISSLSQFTRKPHLLGCWIRDSVGLMA